MGDHGVDLGGIVARAPSSPTACASARPELGWLPHHRRSRRTSVLNGGFVMRRTVERRRQRVKFAT